MIFSVKVLFLTLLFIAPLVAVAIEPAPIQDIAGIDRFVGAVLTWVSGIFWTIAIIAVFYAAYLFLNASGDEERVSKAKRQLLYAIIAMAIAIMAPGLKPLIRNILGGGSSTAVPDISNIPLDPNRGSNVPPLTPPLTPGGSLPSQPVIPPGGPVRDKDF